MRIHITSAINRLTVVALLVALIGSAVQVTPVYAASIVVNTNADNEANDGKCTLREAINAANVNAKSGNLAGECAAGSPAGVDSITFAANYTIDVGSGGTILKQLPYITSAITITGKVAANTVLQAAGTPNTATWRVFQVTPTGALTLDGITVQNGQCDNACTTLGGVEANAGGGIHNSGMLTLKNSIISGNRGTLGGGIYNLGTLNIENSTFLQNNAFRISTAEDGGGAIYNSGNLTITNSMFSTNKAEKNGGGIFNSINGNVTLTNSTVSESTGKLGGGIFNNGGTMTVTNSTISKNISSQAIDDDGGGGIRNAGTLTVTGSILSENSAHGGGGILNFGNLTMQNSILTGNTGGFGAGMLTGICKNNVCSNDTTTIINTVFSGNTATVNAGAIYNNPGSSLKVQDSTFLNNTSEWAGAIANDNGSIEIKSSAFTGNISQSNYGGAIYNFNFFGTSAKTGTVTNSTFYGNSAADGGGILNREGYILVVTNSTFSSNSGGGISNLFDSSVTLKNTIVANNSGGNCSGLITNGGNNLDSGTSCGFGSSNGSLSSTNPKLGMLDYNGGPTQTMRLLAGSPAIDAGDASICSTSPVNGVDQRGAARPLGASCDIGAYESMNGAGPKSAGVFRPSNGLLYLKQINTTGFADVAINYGTGGDYPVVGDWNGDGTATIGIYRNGSFYLRNSNTVGFADLVFAFGIPGDQPIAGDWDGDGTDTIGVFRPSTGQFLLRNSNSAGDADMSFYLGNVGDVGIAGDWDGDGMDTTGVFRPINGIIFLKNTNATGFADIALNYGIPGDRPVTGDWDGDGMDTIGVYRGNTFYLRNSNTVGFADIVFALGIPGDMPIAGNWDGHP